jgi:hypothetical protein
MNGMAVFEQETNVCVMCVSEPAGFVRARDHNVRPDMWWVADNGSKVWVGGTEIVGARGN